MHIVLPPDLTVAQAGIWLDQHLFPGRPIYNTGGFLTIRGDLRFDLFASALRQTVAESPLLRLPPRTGALPFDLPMLDFRDRKDPLAAALQWMRTELGRPLSLEEPALYRFALLRIGEDQTLWFLKTHHLIIELVGRHHPAPPHCGPLSCLAFRRAVSRTRGGHSGGNPRSRATLRRITRL